MLLCPCTRRLNLPDCCCVAGPPMDQRGARARSCLRARPRVSQGRGEQQRVDSVADRRAAPVRDPR
eukprot:5656979-Prymnesium_polylepis.1